MLRSVGKESEFSKEELRRLTVKTNYQGQVTEFPTVAEGWHVACAFNQWGIAGMAKMFVCENLADMQQLADACNRGGAMFINWYSVPDTHFVKVMTFAEWVGQSRTGETSSKPHRPSGMQP